jgi:hypothetical protein
MEAMILALLYVGFRYWYRRGPGGSGSGVPAGGRR